METSKPSSSEGPDRPEELIVEVYRQYREQIEAGGRPTRVLLTTSQYNLLQSYRARLGEMPDNQLDYLERYAIFGLEMHVSDAVTPVVE